MKELYLAFGLLIVGFAALAMRATQEPYDFRAELKADPKWDGSLTNAFEKVLDKQKNNKTKAQPTPGQ